MDNEDTIPDQSNAVREASRVAPADSFTRALAKVQVATDELGAAIAANDPAATAAAASDACSFLLAGVAAFRRLGSPPVQQEASRIDAAWYGLRTHHRALVDLYTRAQTQLASRDLHRMLDELRITLTLAIRGLGGPLYRGPR